ncbi:MAG: hypothetical protein QOK44_3209 [Betaproteobacteria bacterium]|jgi:hypothetical protein|nr:hypothetical protein [Betaproteobacteria bacterium]
MPQQVAQDMTVTVLLEPLLDSVSDCGNSDSAAERRQKAESLIQII